MLRHQQMPLGDVEGEITMGPVAAEAFFRAFMDAPPGAEVSVRCATDGHEHIVVAKASGVNLAMTVEQARGLADAAWKTFTENFGSKATESLDDLVMALRQAASGCEALAAAEAKRRARAARRSRPTPDDRSPS